MVVVDWQEDEDDYIVTLEHKGKQTIIAIPKNGVFHYDVWTSVGDEIFGLNLVTNGHYL